MRKTKVVRCVTDRIGYFVDGIFNFIDVTLSSVVVRVVNVA